MDLGDLIFVLIYIYIAWTLFDDNGSGGRRDRVPSL